MIKLLKKRINNKQITRDMYHSVQQLIIEGNKDLKHTPQVSIKILNTYTHMFTSHWSTFPQSKEEMISYPSRFVITKSIKKLFLVLFIFMILYASLKKLVLRRAKCPNKLWTNRTMKEVPITSLNKKEKNCFSRMPMQEVYLKLITMNQQGKKISNEASFPKDMRKHKLPNLSPENAG